MDEYGLPESICTCPFELDCKHGVAVVIEYLKRFESKQRVPNVKEDDERLELFFNEYSNETPDVHEKTSPEKMHRDIDNLLKRKTRIQLIDIIHDFTERSPEIGQDLIDQGQHASGSAKKIVERLQKKIRLIGDEPVWQDPWEDKIFVPEYSGIRKKIEILLKAGYADELLPLGRELVSSGIRQVEMIHDDEGEVADCMPLIVKALDQSSLTPSEKLNWALNAVLVDNYDICHASD